MIPKIQFHLTIDRDPRMMTRDHATAARESFGEAAEEHWRRHIPWHFEPFARSKYGYLRRTSRVSATRFEQIGLPSPAGPGERRTGSYQGFKDRLGLPDLVFSGATKRQVTSQRQITKTQNGARLLLRLPLVGGTGSFRMKPGQTSLSDQQKVVLQLINEVGTIAPDETNHLARFIGFRYAERCNAPGMTYKKTIG